MKSENGDVVSSGGGEPSQITGKALPPLKDGKRKHSRVRSITGKTGFFGQTTISPTEQDNLSTQDVEDVRSKQTSVTSTMVANK